MLGDTNFRPRVLRDLLVRGAKFNIERLSIANDPTFPPREVVRHPGAVIILPLLDPPARDSRIVLIRNWRISLETFIWELPAGTMEPPEPPQACAERELVEETGFVAATIRPLCRFHTSPGLSDELMHAFVAQGLRPGPQHLQPDERVTVHPLPAYEVFDMIDRGELTDAKSMLVLGLARHAGLLPV